MSASLILDGFFANARSSRPKDVELISFSMPAAVLNLNAAQAQADPDDPYRILSGDDVNHANVVPMAVPTGSYLFLSHVWTSTDDDDDVNQAPVVRVFGRVPPHSNPGRRRLPSDHSSSFPEPYDLPPAGSRGLWVPLTKPGYTKGTPTLELSNNGIVVPHGSGEISGQSEEDYVFLAGADQIIVAVSTAATWTGGSGTRAGMIVGRLVG